MLIILYGNVSLLFNPLLAIIHVLTVLTDQLHIIVKSVVLDSIKCVETLKEGFRG